MRSLLLFGVVVLAACSEDGRQGTTGFTGAATTVTTAATDAGSTAAAATGDASSSDASGAVVPTETGPMSTGGVSTDATSTTAADSSGGEAASTGASDGSTVAGTTTGDSGDAGCPPAGAQDCSPGPGSGEADTCAKGETCFRTTVQEGVKQVLAEHPEWFMHDDMGDYVVEVELYMDTVVEKVAATGLCAIRDPNAGDEIAVKFNNAYAESFDILTAAGYARYGEGIYTATCAPAWF